MEMHSAHSVRSVSRRRSLTEARTSTGIGCGLDGGTRIIFAGSDDTTMASNGIGLEWDVKHIKTLSYELRVRIPNELNQENETASGLYKRHVLLCRGEKRENLTKD